jgi:twinkle protein
MQLVIVANETHAKTVRMAGKKAASIDPKLGGEQILCFSPASKEYALKSEFESYHQFVLALPAGLEALRDDLAIRLGDERTKYVEWPALNGSEKLSVDALLSIARPMWTEEIAKLSDIPEPGEELTFESGFPTLDAHGFRFVLPAFMSLIGPYGSGKSVLLRQLLINLWRLHGWKFLLTSFEEKVKPRYRRDLRRNLLNAPIRDKKTGVIKHPARILRIEDWTDKDCIKADIEIDEAAVFMRRKRGTTIDLSYLLDRIEFAVRVYGVRVVAIDPVNEVDHQPTKGESKTDYMGRFIMGLKQLADDYGLLVIVCAHPPKDGTDKRYSKSPLLTLNDAADTAHYGNKSDIGWCVWRRVIDENAPTYLNIDKLKDHESMGKPTLAELILEKDRGGFQVARTGYEIIKEQILAEAEAEAK